MNIIHIITNLGDGGTEKVLFNICKYDHKNKHTVICLKKSGKYHLLLTQLGIKVLFIKINLFSIYKFLTLIRTLKNLKPDIVQTWLPHSDFIGGIAARLSGINRVVWNIRYTRVNGVVKLRTIILIHILSKLSNFIPKKIIVVSKSALRNCIDLGYKSKKLNLVQNGYDLSIFNPLQKKNFIRKKFRIEDNIPLLGKVARYDLTKDHSNLLNSLSILKKKNIKFFCILIGSNINNSELVKEIKRLELSENIKLISKCNDISEYMKELDIHILTSRTEGFPNVVAESMACGTPCVVTNVGDAALIVGKTGWVVPPEDSIKLAKTIKEALSEIGNKDWDKRCSEARLRIKNNFEMSKMIKSYNIIWSNLLNEI